MLSSGHHVLLRQAGRRRDRHAPWVYRCGFITGEFTVLRGVKLGPISVWRFSTSNSLQARLCFGIGFRRAAPELVFWAACACDISNWAWVARAGHLALNIFEMSMLAGLISVPVALRWSLGFGFSRCGLVLLQRVRAAGSLTTTDILFAYGDGQTKIVHGFMAASARARWRAAGSLTATDFGFAF